MNRFYLPRAFKTPENYQVPEMKDMRTNTENPELNSKHYRFEVSHYTAPNKYNQFYTSISQNEDGLFILATNEYSTCIQTGVLGGTYDFNELVESDFKKAKFTATCRENILNLYYLNNITFLGTTSANNIDMYSTKAPITLEKEKDHRDKFCFIKTTSQVADGKVTCFCLSNDKKHFIVGTSRGHFESYEFDSKFMSQRFTLPYAHFDEINGISTHPTLDVNWISVSSDKSCTLWDKRHEYPGTSLVKNHESRLTDVHYFDINTAILSDSNGKVLVYDLRSYKQPICQQQVINKTIKSLTFHDNKFGIISESCKALIYEVDEKKELKLIHEHNARPYILNSLCWDIYSKKNTFYVVGNRKYAKEVTIETQD